MIKVLDRKAGWDIVVIGGEEGMAEIVFPEHGLRVVEGLTLPVRRDRVSVEDYERGTHVEYVKMINFLSEQIDECREAIRVGSGSLDLFMKLADLQGKLITRLQEYTEVKKSEVKVIPPTFVEVDLEEFKR